MASRCISSLRTALGEFGWHPMRLRTETQTSQEFAKVQENVKNHCKNKKKQKKIRDMAGRRQRCQIDLSDFFGFFRFSIGFFYNFLPLSRFRETYAKTLSSLL